MSAEDASRRLVDPDLLPALDAMPAFTVSAETLDEVRAAVAALTVPAPPAPATRMEQRFAPGPDGPVRVLVCTPERPRRTGALLWLHGGGMVLAKPDGNEPLCRYLAQIAGCVVVAPEYRLAPEHPHPAGLDDCMAVLDWLYASAKELDFPPERIVVAGESGGGCLAAGLAMLDGARTPARLAAQILLYPMLDDRTGTDADPDPMPHTGAFVWTRESNAFAWRSVLGRAPGGGDVPVLAAPARAERLPDMPPTTIIVGDLDLFLGDALRYAAALSRGASPVNLRTCAGAYHGFISFAQDAPVSKRAFADFSDAVVGHFRR